MQKYLWGKRAAVLLLTGVLCLSFIACGQEDTNPGYTVGGSAAIGESSSGNGKNADTNASDEVGESVSIGEGTSKASDANIDSTSSADSGVKDEDYDPNELVWVMSSVENPMGSSAYFYAKMLESDAYYADYKNPEEVIKYSFMDGERTALPLTWPEEFLMLQHNHIALEQIAIGVDGSIYVMALCELDDSGNKTPFLCKFDSDGQHVYSQNVIERMHEVGEPSWSSQFRLEADAEGRVYLSHRYKVFLYNTDGSYYGAIEVIGEEDQIDKWICDVKRGPDEKVYLHYSRKWGNPGYLAEFDFEGKKLAVTYEVKCGREMTFSSDEGLFVSNDDYGLYKYTADLGQENQAGTLLFNWSDYGIDGQKIQRISETEDGKILVLYYNSSSCDTFCFEQMTRAEAEALKAQKKTVTIGVFGEPGEGLTNAVMEFNKESEDYIVEIENYIDPFIEDAVQVGMDRLGAELAAGKGPDIIDIQYLDVESLVEKGVFENLHDYLNISGGLAASNFSGNILDAYTVGDVLVAIPHEFILQTIVGPTDLVGEEAGWTLQEFVEFANRNRGTELFNRMTKSQMLNSLMLFNESLFIDWENATCSFDSREFQDLLQLVKEMDDKLTVSDVQTSIFTRLQNDEVLLANVRINQYGDLQPYEAAFGGKMTCIGYPASEGSGCLGTAYGLFAISSQSKSEEGAWNFLEYYLQQDSSFGTFPSLERTMKAQIAEYQETSANTTTNYPDGWSYEHHEATQEEIDEFYSLVASARFDSVSTDVLNIITEEAESFFLGQKPADVVVGIIQNRVRNYMEEQQ